MVTNSKILFTQTLTPSIDSAAAQIIDFNNQIVIDSNSYSEAAGRVTVTEPGRYIVLYDVSWLSTFNGRESFMTEFFINGVVSKYGRKIGYCRNLFNDIGYNWGIAVFNNLAANDIIDVRITRVGGADGEAVNLRATGAMAVYQIPDTDDMLELSTATSDLTNYNAGVDDVFADYAEWDTQDLIDTDAFEHSLVITPASIILKPIGNYLVIYTLQFDNTNNNSNRNALEARLTVAGAAYPYGREFQMTRGNVTSDETLEGAMCAAAIVTTTAINTDVRIQIAKEGEGAQSGAPTMNSVADKMAIQIIKLPDEVDIMRIRDVAGGEELNPGVATTLDQDTNDTLDTGFTHTVNGDIGLPTLKNPDILMGASTRGKRTDEASNVITDFFHTWRDVDNALDLNYGIAGVFVRGNQGASLLFTSAKASNILIHDVDETKNLWRLRADRATNNDISQPQTPDLQGIWAINLSTWMGLRVEYWQGQIPQPLY